MSYLLFIFQLIAIKSSYIIKFKKYFSIKNDSLNINLYDFINQRINNIYITNIYLGDPPQAISAFLKTQEYKFFISNDYCNRKEYYFKEKSKTFSYVNSNDNHKGIKIIDSLFFNSSNNNIKLDNITLIVENDMKSPICFHIGTQLLMKSEEKEKNLIDILHKRKYMKSYFYKYKINNDNELDLILDLNIDINNKNLKFIKPIIFQFYPTPTNYYKWGLIFENLKLNNYTLKYEEDIKAEFDINNGCIIGSSDFKGNFDKYLKDNEINIEKRYLKMENYIYYFDKKIKGIEKLKNFEFIFYHRELDFNFTFNYNDLFLESSNGYYFLIIFDYKNRNDWVFGSPFFKKYDFVFNHDSKLMGFNCKNLNLYNDIKYSIDKKDNKVSNKFAYNVNIKIILLIIFGFIFLILIILFFGILIGKKLFGIRKTKVNELLELFDYSAKNTDK